MNLICRVCPKGPIDRPRVFAKIFVNDPAHEMIVHGCLQRHVMQPARDKLLQIPSEPFRTRVAGIGSGLPRIVMANIDGGPFFNRAPLDRDDLIFQYGRVIIEVALKDGSLRDLDEPSRDLKGTQRFHPRVGGLGCGWAGRFTTGDERESDRENGRHLTGRAEPRF